MNKHIVTRILINSPETIAAKNLPELDLPLFLAASIRIKNSAEGKNPIKPPTKAE
jgi:hypothetical protein